MQIILETSSIRLAHEFMDKLGGRIVAYEGCPVEECGEHEMTHFSELTVEIEVPADGEESSDE